MKSKAFCLGRGSADPVFSCFHHIPWRSGFEALIPRREDTDRGPMEKFRAPAPGRMAIALAFLKPQDCKEKIEPSPDEERSWIAICKSPGSREQYRGSAVLSDFSVGFAGNQPPFAILLLSKIAKDVVALEKRKL